MRVRILSRLLRDSRIQTHRKFETPLVFISESVWTFDGSSQSFRTHWWVFRIQVFNLVQKESGSVNSFEDRLGSIVVSITLSKKLSVCIVFYIYDVLFKLFQWFFPCRCSSLLMFGTFFLLQKVFNHVILYVL